MPAPSLAEWAELTRRLHALEGRHTTRVDGKLVRSECPPGEFRCFCGTTEELAARIAQTRVRIAALAGRSAQLAADGDEKRREQLNRWHRDDHATDNHADAAECEP